MKNQKMFHNRRLFIATKHHKEKVLAPIFEKELGVICFTEPTYDTDVLGTFTGEIERELTPIAAAREKCLRGMKHFMCDLAIASEGSFGPHPYMFFKNADDEFLIFIDLLNKIEIIVRELSFSTNFNGATIHSQKELLAFAESAGFPSHALILRKSKEDLTGMIKGIDTMQHLLEVYDELQVKYNSVYVETDMRAMHNPTRMKVIELAAEKLILKIKSECPECKMPGFAITDSKNGLRCSLCGLPTNSIQSHLYVCQHCSFSKEELYPNNKTYEDPMYCDNCNP